MRDQPVSRRTIGALSGALFAAAALLYIVFIARTTFTDRGHLVGTLFDDALISMRYADNLVNGHGLVWNAGEQPPVEGYTNLAWTLVMSAVLVVCSKTIAPIVVSALGAATLLASGFVAQRMLRRLETPPPVQLAGAALVLTYYPLVFWTLRGMEVGLLAWLVLVASAIALRPPSDTASREPRDLVLLSAIAGAAFLTRNDSALVFAGLLAFAAYERRAWKQVPLAVAPFAACILLQFVFRSAYYHELMPNTYVLKMTGVRIAERLSRGLNAFAETMAPLAWLSAVGAAASLSPAVPRPIRRLLMLGLALVAIQSAYVIWVGGDAWDFDHSNRFIATVMPVLLTGVVAAAPFSARVVEHKASALAGLAFTVVLLQTLWLFPAFEPASNRMMTAGWAAGMALAGAAFTARESPSRRQRLATASVLVATLLVPSGYSWLRWASRNGIYVANDIETSRLGLAFRDRLPPGTVIAAGWLGAPAYFSGLPAIDIFGKTDKHIARIPPTLPFRPGHNKEDLSYSIGTLRPDLVLIGIDRPEVETYGYTRVAAGIYVRRDVATSGWAASAFPGSARR